MLIPEPLQAAIDELSKFPGIGRKTAQRLALFLLKRSPDEIKQLTASIASLKEKLHACPVCFSITHLDICEICSSVKRDKSVICVVEEASDIFAIEKSNEYNGLYHVLGGVLSPLSGVNPDDLNIRQLLSRVTSLPVAEIILALNPNTEGETTSLYLSRQLKQSGIKVTRIARGLPVGGDLEFSDEATIGKAVTARVEI